jgi:glutaminase
VKHKRQHINTLKAQLQHPQWRALTVYSRHCCCSGMCSDLRRMHMQLATISLGKCPTGLFTTASQQNMHVHLGHCSRFEFL